jgi:L-alanine-DL-glutamate epimerase-like enolase superfamily enzyme
MKKPMTPAPSRRGPPETSLSAATRRAFLQAAPGAVWLAAPADAAAPPAEALRIREVAYDRKGGFLRLRTDAVTGSGPLDVTHEGEAAESLGRAVLRNADAAQREAWWAELRRRGAPPAVLAALDLALWDLLGQAWKLPVFRLLGGFRDLLPACRAGAPERNLERLVEAVGEARRQGYRAYRSRARLPVAETERMASRVRAAAGDDFVLIHDALGQFDFADAVRAGRALEQAGYAWLENPLADRAAAPRRRLCAALDLPVAANVTLASAAAVLAEQSADLLVARVPGDAGFTGLVKMARLAEAFGVFLELAAAPQPLLGVQAHLLGAVRNAMFFFAETAVPLADGQVRVPAAPGFGRLGAGA